MPKIIIAFLGAMLFSYVLTPYVIKLAHRIGAIDVPKDDRRVHSKPIPRLGGIAIFGGFFIVSTLLIPPSREMMGFLLASVIMIIMGILDDTRGLGAKTKLLIQIACALIVFVFGVRIEFLTNPFDKETGMLYLGILALPLTVFWIVGITNTVNLIDGLDGLAAGISAISAITLSFIAYMSNDITSTILLVALAGGAIGFLPFNFNPAKIFMGDTGSLFLGFALSVISIEAAIKSAATLAVVVPILALGIPIFDTTFAIIRRANAGRPIMEADKGHLHHRLLSRGLSQKQTVIALYLMSCILGASAIFIAEASMKSAMVVLTLDLLLIIYGVFRLKILTHIQEEVK
ncbi:glycosyltransferase family 4 protein [Acetoanaerobium sticklandii]|uniref:glycosyltransferase family 4 protein n=1 Tax=Acetoanaerobium sticklandii TaxID=1511 RepID=UPI003A915E79